MKNTQKDHYYSKLMRFLKELNARNPQRIDVYENRRTELMKKYGFTDDDWYKANKIMGLMTDEDYWTEDNSDECEIARLEWLNRILLNQILVKGVLNGVRKEMFSNETISLEEAEKEEDELREKYAKFVGSSASNKSELFDWYLFELQKWTGVYGYFIRRKDYATAEVVKYITSLSPEKKKEGCCDPAPQIKVIALLDTNCYTDIGFYLVCQTKPIDDKIFKIEKNFAQIRDIICSWDV